uniref:F-box domain-containing protein n=1 Tax=Parascaris univalens TaxID=6257 RepID=A0A915B4U8_PARUN
MRKLFVMRYIRWPYLFHCRNSFVAAADCGIVEYIVMTLFRRVFSRRVLFQWMRDFHFFLDCARIGKLRCRKCSRHNEAISAHCSMQFAAGMETKASFLLPFPSKYITIDKRYKFSERPNSTSLFMDYPLSESKYTRKWCYGRKSYLSASRSSSCLVMAAGRTIPDVVLLTIFKYLHPVDLVNGASYVSKRWNLLSKTPSLYRHVRVLVNKQSVNYESAKEFLQRVRSHVGRLCLVYEQGVFADVLPDSMPNVTTLDIGFFPEIADAAEKLITCFPSIETLNMEDVKNVDAAVVRRLFCEGSFRRLRRLCFRPEGDLPDTFIPLLSTSNRLLEVLSAKADHTNMSSLLNTPISLSLTHLYLTGFMENEAFATIGQLKNLTTFSLFSCLYTFDDHILELKQLSKLEHLHLCCSGQDCDISPDGLVELFRLPSKNPSNFFPFRLKYLCFMDCYSFNLEVVTELSKSCPGLESLCVAHDEFMDEEAFSMLITNFRKLRFLDISGLGEMKCGALRHLADDELPELRFLSLHDTKVEEKMLRTLNLKRPELFVTTRPGFFINWSLQDGSWKKIFEAM